MSSTNLSQEMYLTTFLQEIEFRRKTGLLVISHKEMQADLYFLQGKIVGITPLCEYASVGMSFIQVGFFNQMNLLVIFDRIKQTFGKLPDDEMQLAMVLANFGILNQEQLSKWITQEVTKKLLEVLSWPTPTVHFEEQAQPAAGQFPLMSFRVTSLVPSLAQVDHTLKLPTRNPGGREAQSSIHIPYKFKQTSGELLKMARGIALPYDETATAILVIPRQSRRSILNWETLLIVALLLIAGLAHGINMFHFPYMEDDEGTYISQAMAIFQEGRLAYYTYWYDHAPVGWMQLALWGVMTNGFHLFGSTINSGRVFMLLMQLGSTFLLYRIARSISTNVLVGVIACLIFSLSPLGIYFHRRILLDNIATFWMLLSIYCLVGKQISLQRVWLSAVTLGISILSKEVTLFLIPVMWYLVFVRSHKSHRRIAVVGWITLLSCIISLYVLMALVKNEFFPTGTLLGGMAPHVSLLTTLGYQSMRGHDGGLFDLYSAFWVVVREWSGEGPLLIIGGLVSTIFVTCLIRWHKVIGIMGLLSLSLWLFLMRGGEVLDFYFVPLLPLLALNIGIVIGLPAVKLKNYVVRLCHGNTGIKIIGYGFQLMLVFLCLCGTAAGYLEGARASLPGNPLLLWNGAPVDGQNQAISWVEEHIPRDSRIVIDMYMWPDLHDAGYTYAHYYWKVEEDPAIGGTIFHNDWRNVDYIVTTGQMLSDAQINNMQLINDLVAHSTVVAKFDTGGWPVIIRKVHR